MHFYDASYPTAPAATLFPSDATPQDYRLVQQALGLQRVVVVQPTTYGLDNSCQLAGMAEFGDNARGVMVIDGSVERPELVRLTRAGVRGARFHMLPGGAVGWEHLEPVAAAIAEFDWHIQLQCNGRELADRFDQLARLPTALVVDHVGRFMPPVPPDHLAYRALARLLDAGRTWVKLSAPYESSQQPILNGTAAAMNHEDVLPLIDDLVEQYSERMLWATNWPHPGQDPYPSEATLQGQLERWLPSNDVRKQVLEANPNELYFSS